MRRAVSLAVFSGRARAGTGPAAAIAAAASLVWGAAAQAPPADPAALGDAPWRDLLLEIPAGAPWHVGARLGSALASLPGDRVMAILEPAWARIDARARAQILKGFNPAFNRSGAINPRYFDVMHLGMTDPDPVVRETFAASYVSGLTFRDFSADPEAYAAWRRETAGKPAAEICLSECRRFLAGSRVLPIADAPPAAARLGGAANDLREFGALRRTALEAGLVDLIESSFRAGIDVAAHPALYHVLANLHAADPQDPGDTRLARIVLPLLSGADPEARDQACDFVGSVRAAWAVDPLVDLVAAALRAPGDAGPTFVQAGGALSRIGDPRAVPHLIAVIEADERYALRKQACRHLGPALASFTPEQAADATRDGVAWARWWDAVRGRFGEPAASMEVPRITLDEETVLAARLRLAGEPAAATLVQESRAGGDVDKQYFLIGPRPGDAMPPEGWGLVVIVPGGDGGPGFHPWCRRMVEEAFPPGFVGAQLVAPVWSADPRRVVWPRRRLNPDRAGFVTEDFILQVVAEVRCRMSIDVRRIVALGWSSGGPPVYAVALDPAGPVSGALVAMSVFQPETLPPLAGAAGRSFYILHSPQDALIPIALHAQAAEGGLADHGARVTLATYTGGHGWHDDPMGRIRLGIEWLAGSQWPAP